MSFLYRTLKLHIVVVVIALLCGCSDKSQLATTPSIAQTNEITQSQIDPSTVNQPKIKQKEVKPGAAVKIISPSIITINPNENTSINILLESNETSGELQVELSSSNELNLLNTALLQTTNLASSSTIQIPVTLFASANGRYYLKVRARINNGDEASVRNLAVIIQVGPVAEKTVQFKKVSGENVISLPAHETISTQ